VVRGTTRDPSHAEEIDAAGIEAVIGDPERVATLTPALDHVSVACVLLGSASGDAEALAALHGSRLAMLLQRMVDTTVRGVVYESAGGVGPERLSAGAERVRSACEDARIPYALLDTDPGEHGAWLEAAIGAVEHVLSAR
jgi:uncharacterized protein YbjT (DUF2867 family)